MLAGGEGDDSMAGGAGDDWMLGSGGNDAMDGGAGADVVNGGDGNDQLGGMGDGTRDYLNGGTGDDVLTAGAGDNLNGGEGADRFEVGREAGDLPVVDDFDAAADSLAVVYEADGPVPELSQRLDGDGVVLMADGTEVAKVLGVTEIDLSAVVMIPE
jgi:Ca2+-binding RTX toxin-like protein